MKRSVCRSWFAVLPVLSLACNIDPEIRTGGGAGGSNIDIGFNTGGTSGGASGGKEGGFPLLAGAGGGGTSGGGGMLCGLEKFDLERLPPEVLLVQDRSGSLRGLDPPRNTPRWQEVLPAVMEVVNGTAAMVSWGLKFFPSKTDPKARSSGCTFQVDPGVEVPIAANNAPAVIGALTASMLMSSTPTADAIKASVAYLKTLTTKNPKYLLLATDGEPNCDFAKRPPIPAAIAEITDAATAGFKTFVVGISIPAGNPANTLDMMATAGGTARPGTPKHYPTNNRAELVAALQMITTQIANCVFTLSKEPPSPKDVAVNINGMRVEQNAQTGWNYGPGMKTIQLNGAACDGLKASVTAKVDIVFGCPGVIIP